MARGKTLLLGMLVVAGGCDWADAFRGDDTVVVNAYVTHHGAARDGTIPDYGEPNQSRHFETDEGWNVTIEDGFTVTTAVALERCDGEVVELEPFWGALAESVTRQDLDLLTFGGTETTSGSVCAVVVSYGPCLPGDEVSDQPDDMADLLGASAFLRGFAMRGDEAVSFFARTTESFTVRVPLSTPLELDADEPFPAELTIARTYDRFFDATEMDNVTDDDLGQSLAAVLPLETTVHVGTRVDPAASH